MYDNGNTTTTQLLTLLNVSATRISKRKREDKEAIPVRSEKLNKRRSGNDFDVHTAPTSTDQIENTIEESEMIEEDELTSDRVFRRCPH